jgi:hypothetical protein
MEPPYEYKIIDDPEWILELAKFFNKKGNMEKFFIVKKVFCETYLENVREGMKPEAAIEKAKSVAICFLNLR